MNLFEGIWFLLAIFIIFIILVVDPKNNVSGLSNNSLLAGFSSPSSKQNFIYNLNAIFIIVFITLTVVLNYLTF